MREEGEEGHCSWRKGSLPLVIRFLECKFLGKQVSVSEWVGGDSNICTKNLKGGGDMKI